MSLELFNNKAQITGQIVHIASCSLAGAEIIEIIEQSDVSNYISDGQQSVSNAM